MKFYTLFLFLLTSTISLNGQGLIDNNETQQIEILLDSSNLTKNNDKKILLSLYNKSKKTKNYKMLTKASCQLSEIYMKDVVLDSALYYCNIAEYLHTSFGIRVKKTEELLLQKSRILIRTGLYEFALKNLQKAYEISLSNNDIELSSEVLVDMSICYTFLEDYDQARLLLMSYLNNKVKNKRLIKAYNMIAVTYTEQNNFDKAISYYRKALEVAQNQQNTIEQAGINLNIAIMYSLDKKFIKALEYCVLAEDKIANYTDHLYEIPHLINLTRGQSYLGLKIYDKAEFYLVDVFSTTGNHKVKEDVCNNLVDLYRQTGDSIKTILYYEKLTKILEKTNELSNKEFIKVIDRQRELIDQEFKNQKLNSENALIKAKNIRQNIIIFSLAIILIISTLGLYFSYKYIQGKKTIAILKEKEEKLLKEQIRIRDNEIGATVIGISKRVTILNDIKNDLRNKKDLNKVEEKIKDLINSAIDLNAITDRIESQFPDFTSVLSTNYPELTISEIRYCLLTKLNMSIKETASILNVSPNTVKVTRSKLKKKMNVPAEIPLRCYLEEIL